MVVALGPLIPAIAQTDSTPPTVVSLSSSPKTASPGSTVTFTAHITDAGSGVAQAGMCVITPTGSTGGCPNFSLISGSVNDGTWRGTYQVPLNAPNGTWTIFDLFAIDAAAN